MADLITFVNLPSDTKPIITADRALVISFTRRRRTMPDVDTTGPWSEALSRYPIGSGDVTKGGLYVGSYQREAFIAGARWQEERAQSQPPSPSEVFDAANDLVWLSEWIDAGNAHRDPEARTWGRIAKLAEETGEVVAAYIGSTGQNPRKGVTHTDQDVFDELLDVAVTALGAAEHLAGHQGTVLDGLLLKIHLVAQRARDTEAGRG